MSHRIKVSPTGAVVVYEPEAGNPNGPWYCMYRGSQMFYTDDEVKDWPDWGPIAVVPEDQVTDELLPAKDIKIGMRVKYRDSWELVRDTGYGDVMQRRLWLGDRKRPTTFTPYEILATRKAAR